MAQVCADLQQTSNELQNHSQATGLLIGVLDIHDKKVVVVFFFSGFAMWSSAAVFVVGCLRERSVQVQTLQFADQTGQIELSWFAPLCAISSKTAVLNPVERLFNFESK